MSSGIPTLRAFRTGCGGKAVDVLHVVVFGYFVGVDVTNWRRMTRRNELWDAAV
jgi:hypothetical protein